MCPTFGKRNDAPLFSLFICFKNPKKMKTNRIFLLWVLTLPAVLLVIPYLIETLESNQLMEALPVSRAVFLVVTFLQSALFLAIACFAGAWFSRKAGLLYTLEWRRGKIISSLLIGVSTGLVILSIDYFFELGGIRPNLFSAEPSTLWKGMLASFYGGIAEEVIMRFFMVALLVFLITKISGKYDAGFRQKAIVAAVIIVAFLFGLGHLPAAGLSTILTVPVVIRVILVNTLGGLIFGFVFIRNGLFHAMIAHFAADLMILFIFPVIYFS